MIMVRGTRVMADQFVQSLAQFAQASVGRGTAPFYREALMNWFGCALAGSQTRAVETLIAFHAADGSGMARPIGRTESLTVSAAVEVDCLASAALAYDDIHFDTTLHPAGPVAAAILGVARTRQVTGAMAIEALRVGMEVECRLAIAMFGGDTGAVPGWYPTGIVGGIGAAAAAGRLLRLDVPTLITSMALAAAKASGTRGTHGAMSAFWPPAIAAEAGYRAAVMASLGYTCPAGALSGPMGLIQQIAPRPAFDQAMRGLGEDHVSAKTASKIYPYGFIAFGPINCALTLQRWKAAAGRRIDRIALHVSPTCARLGGNSLPKSSFEAQVSLACIVARVLTDPALAYAPVSEDFAADHPHADLARRVELIPEERLGDEQCKLTVQYADGGQLTVDCDAAPGSARSPVGSAEVRDKFRRLVTPIRGEQVTEWLMQSFDDLENLHDLTLLQ